MAQISSQAKDSTFIVVRIVLISLAFLIVAATLYILFQLPIGERGFGRGIRNIQEIPKISVQGEGSVFVKPDIAVVHVGAEVERQSVAAAVASNTEIMNATLDFLKESGIEGRDLKTTQYNVFPRYETDRDGRQRLTGYTATQSVQVKIRDFEKIGAILEGAASRGANNIGSLVFTVDDEEAIRKEARDIAIENAKQKARELAGKLEVSLGRVIDFQEGFFGAPFYAKGGFGGEFSLSAAPTIEPGENETKVTVTITYELK